jgi:branched-chain amino acid transport system substrate-binding protein
MHRRIRVTIWTFLIGAIAVGLGVAAADAASLTLGEINPLTGRFAAHGTALHRGIQLAVEDANASAALRVILATRDDEGRPERAVAAGEELTTRLRLAALVGGYVDTLVGPISEVAERQQVPYVAAASWRVPRFSCWMIRSWASRRTLSRGCAMPCRS